MRLLLLCVFLAGCSNGKLPQKLSLDDGEPAYTITAEGFGMRQPTNEAATLAREGDRLFLR